jgi:sugar-specific transcriptional regulator TrmB
MESVRDTDIFKELELLHTSGIKHVDVTDLSNSMVGRDNINRQIKTMVEGAKKFVTIATTEEGFKRKAKLLKNYVSGLKKKGVKLKIIAPVDSVAAKKVQGAELKDMKNETRFINVDNKELMFMLNEKDPEYDIGIWVKSDFFVKAYSEMFERSLK